MKEILVQLSIYHLWANQQLVTLIRQLPEAQQQQKLSSSFSSLYHTLLHMWSAESIWWQRLKLQERVIAPMDHFNGSFSELSQQYLLQNQQWQEWVASAQEHMLEHVFHYQNTKREQFKQPVYQMLLHLFNHGTYHRGQIVNMLRQLGVEKIPQTDFIVWSRKKGS
jgi:uncharacterized damage-inducible protein DinB